MAWSVPGTLVRALACLALAAGVHQITPGPETLRAGLALFTLIGGMTFALMAPVMVHLKGFRMR